QTSDFRLPGDLDEMTTKRVRRVLRLWIAEGRFGFAAACDQAEVGALKQICERHARRTVSLYKDPAAFECQLVGFAFLERRSRRSTFAAAANRAAIHVHPAIPQSRIKPSRFMEPTSGVRLDQPNFSAPSSKHSSKWRDENGSRSPSSIFGSFMMRNLTGSILSRSASSFIADSVA